MTMAAKRVMFDATYMVHPKSVMRLDATELEEYLAECRKALVRALNSTATLEKKYIVRSTLSFRGEARKQGEQTFFSLGATAQGMHIRNPSTR